MLVLKDRKNIKNTSGAGKAFFFSHKLKFKNVIVTNSKSNMNETEKLQNDIMFTRGHICKAAFCYSLYGLWVDTCLDFRVSVMSVPFTKSQRANMWLISLRLWCTRDFNLKKIRNVTSQKTGSDISHTHTHTLSVVIVTRWTLSPAAASQRPPPGGGGRSQGRRPGRWECVCWHGGEGV